MSNGQAVTRDLRDLREKRDWPGASPARVAPVAHFVRIVLLRSVAEDDAGHAHGAETPVRG